MQSKSVRHAIHVLLCWHRYLVEIEVFMYHKLALWHLAYKRDLSFLSNDQNIVESQWYRMDISGMSAKVNTKNA